MTTTQLFVELLINGLGAVVWLAFLLALILDLPWNNLLLSNATLVLPSVFSIAYVLGIIVDRIAYSLFKKREDTTIRNKAFGPGAGPTADEIDDMATYIRTCSESLTDQMTYNRSRLRICRSWILNFLLISVLSALWNLKAAVFPFYNSVLLSLLGAFFSVMTFVTWQLLSIDDYKNTWSCYKFLRENESVRG